MDGNDMDLSERELLALTWNLDEMHQDLFPRFRGALVGLGEEWRDRAEEVRRVSHLNASRRNFLRGGLVTAGALGGGMVVAGCGGSSSPTGGTGTAPTTTTTTSAGADLAVARLAASVEVLAVNTYQAVLDAAQRGSLGTVPPAIATFVTTAKMQHAEHEQAWNSALTGAGMKPQTSPDPKYQAIVSQALPGVRTVMDACRLALTLETIAVETYTSGAMSVTEPKSREVALTIAPVEAQHVAILNLVLGTYPVPDTFTKVDQAATTSDLASS
jgi:Ferritin-like domain